MLQWLLLKKLGSFINWRNCHKLDLHLYLKWISRQKKIVIFIDVAGKMNLDRAVKWKNASERKDHFLYSLRLFLFEILDKIKELGLGTLCERMAW